MNDKDPKDMTASELMRYLHSREISSSCTLCNKVLNIDGCENHKCNDVYKALANKIDDEVHDARTEGISEGIDASLRQGAVIWAKANGWPDFKDGEDFGAWLDRCALPRPRFEDGEPVQFGDSPVGLDGVEKFIFARSCGGSCQMQDANGNMLTVFPGDRVKRPAPEVLGADGLPLNEDDTAYGTGREQHRYTVQVPFSINDEVGERFCVQCYDHDEGSVVWCDPSMLTHTPPDTQERIDADARKDTSDYWECYGIDCEECPSIVDGGKPYERHGASSCRKAMTIDLLRRQRELDKRKGGDA